MPPRVFIPIRRRRRPSEVREVDPILARITHGSLLIALGFVVILAGVLVTIFGLNPKNPDHYRPALLNPSARLRSRAGYPESNTRLPASHAASRVSMSLIFGPLLIGGGIVVCIVGAFLYATNYRKKKEKEKEARTQRIQEEGHTEGSSSTGHSASGVCLNCDERQPPPLTGTTNQAHVTSPL